MTRAVYRDADCGIGKLAKNSLSPGSEWGLGRLLRTEGGRRFRGKLETENSSPPVKLFWHGFSVSPNEVARISSHHPVRGVADQPSSQCSLSLRLHGQRGIAAGGSGGQHFLYRRAL